MKKIKDKVLYFYRVALITIQTLIVTRIYSLVYGFPFWDIYKKALQKNLEDL